MTESFDLADQGKQDDLKEEKRWILRRISQVGSCTGEDLLDGLLQQGLPNQPRILLEMIQEGLLFSEIGPDASKDLPPHLWYKMRFVSTQDLVSEKLEIGTRTLFPLDPLEGEPRDVLSLGIGEVYSTVSRILAELLGKPIQLLENGKPILTGFVQICDGIFPPKDQGNGQDWFDHQVTLSLLYVQALIGMGLLVERSRKLEVLEDTLGLFNLPPLHMIHDLYQSFLDSDRDWDLLLAMGKDPQKHNSDLRLPSARARVLARRFVASLLHRLPAHLWLGLEGIIERVYADHRDIFGKESSALHMAALSQDKMRKIWDHTEGAYLRWLLRIAMPAFGTIARAGSQHHEMSQVKITPLPTKSPQETMEGNIISKGQPFICQPTMELLALTDRATPNDLLRLGSMANRTRADVASLYAFTEESYHQYLLSEGTTESAIAFLEERSSQPVPQNVRAALEDWESRFGRVLIYPRATLMEFANEEERAAFTKNHSSISAYKEVGNRFVLILNVTPEETSSLISGSSLFDYDKPASPVFLQRSEHLLEVQLCYADLFALAQGCLFAELSRKNNEIAIFEMTPYSIRNSPLDSDRILRILENRLEGRLSSALPLRIRAWRGELPSLRMEQCVLIQADDEETLHGLLRLPQIKDIATGTLGQTILVVHPNHIEELERVLDAHHIDVEHGLKLHRFAKEQIRSINVTEKASSSPPPGTLNLSTQGTRKLLQKAISEGREVELWVIENDNNQPRRRRVLPEAIRYKGHTPLITCTVVEEGCERHYRIGNIKGLRMASRRPK